MEGKFAAYYRVSTAKQGQSGLGLEGQQEACRNFLNGGSWSLVGEFIEVETGKGKDALNKRPELVKALACAKRNDATLLIAKLDRLSRNLHFITSLMESKVKFVCCDLPDANNLTLHIFGAFAEYEAKRISERTKDALRAAKARGVKLGKIENLQKGNLQRSDKAKEFASTVKPLIEQFQKEGFSQRKIIARLNELGIKTFEGSTWRLLTLWRLLQRYKSD